MICMQALSWSPIYPSRTVELALFDGLPVFAPGQQAAVSSGPATLPGLCRARHYSVRQGNQSIPANRTALLFCVLGLVAVHKCVRGQNASEPY